MWMLDCELLNLIIKQVADKGVGDGTIGVVSVFR